MQNSEGKWTGKIKIQTNKEEEIDALFKLVHGTSVDIDGTHHLLEIISDFREGGKVVKEASRAAGNFQ